MVTTHSSNCASTFKNNIVGSPYLRETGGQYFTFSVEEVPIFFFGIEGRLKLQ